MIMSRKTHTGGVLSLIVLSYAALYIIWGSTYLFIKFAVQSIPPLYVVSIRFFCGGLFFLLFSLVTGRIRRLPTLREILTSFLLGTLLLLGGNGLVTIAERSVDSYLAALIISTTPVVVGLFDWLLFRKKLSLFKGVGVLTGVAGVALLLSDGRTLHIEISPGIMMVVAGLVSWALATSLGHHLKTYPDSFVNSGLQMTFVGAIGLGWLSGTRPPDAALVQSITAVSFGGLLYLTVFGSLAFCAYTYLIRHEPAIRVVSYAFVNPLIAILLGILAAAEPVKPMLFPATFMILAGLSAMLYGDRLAGIVAGAVRAGRTAR